MQKNHYLKKNKYKLIIFISPIFMYFLVCKAKPSLCFNAINNYNIYHKNKIFHVEKFVGEKLQYKIYWSVIHAANAGLSVERLDHNKVRLKLWAKTAPVVKWIYPATDLVYSIVKVPGPIPIHYHKDSKEGWHPRTIIDVLFKNNKCIYYKDKKLKNVLMLKGDVQDPLSAFFVFRCLNFSHSPVHIMMTDGRHIVNGEIYVLGRQVVTTPAGKFKTILIEPRLHGLKGVFRKSPDAKILVWLTDDKWHIPVKMTSKVIVGHFTAELVSYSLSFLEKRNKGAK